MAICRKYDTALTGKDFREFSYRLVECPGFIPDVYRDMPRLIEKHRQTMGECCQPFGIEVGGELVGVFFMSDVVPEHEGAFYLWLWNKAGWTAKTRRFVCEYIEHFADGWKLARVVARTPDDKGLGRLLESCGFRLESRAKSGYKSGGRLMTLYAYRRLFHVGGM